MRYMIRCRPTNTQRGLIGVALLFLFLSCFPCTILAFSFWCGCMNFPVFLFFFYGGEAVLNVHFSREILERLPLVCLKIHQTGGGRVERHFFDFYFFLSFCSILFARSAQFEQDLSVSGGRRVRKMSVGSFPPYKEPGTGKKELEKGKGGGLKILLCRILDDQRSLLYVLYSVGGSRWLRVSLMLFTKAQKNTNKNKI